MAHHTITTGRHSELLAQTALLANGYEVAEPIAPEPYDLVVRPPNSNEWIRVQVKTIRIRSDRGGEAVLYAKKNNGKAYTLDDCDIFAGILDGNVYIFDNREIGEYWCPYDALETKWLRLDTGLSGLTTNKNNEEASA